MEEIQRKIASLIIQTLKLEDITPETFEPDYHLVDDVGIDSMDLATLALVIQDAFGIVINEEDYQDLTTLQKITDYVKKQL